MSPSRGSQSVFWKKKSLCLTAQRLQQKGNAGFSLIDLYSFSNELISQHNVIGFRGPLHIYDGKLQNIYNPNEISWGGDIEKVEAASGFAFIPVALPHCILLPPPFVSFPPTLVSNSPSPPLSFTYHSSAPCGHTGHDAHSQTHLELYFLTI